MFVIFERDDLGLGLARLREKAFKARPTFATANPSVSGLDVELKAFQLSRRVEARMEH